MKNRPRGNRPSTARRVLGAVLITLTMLGTMPAMAARSSALPTIEPDEAGFGHEHQRPDREYTLEIDPKLRSFARLVEAAMDEDAASFLDLSPEDRVRVQRRTERKMLRCEQRGCRATNRFFERQGLSFDVERALEIAELYESLRDDGYSEDEIANTMIQAGGMEYELHETDREVSDVYYGCQKNCKYVYQIETIAAFTVYSSSLAGCTLLGPGAPFCIAAATWAYVQALELAGRRANDCLDRCDELYGEDGSATTGTCEEDSDCGTNQWCDKGIFFGLGYNECKDKKEEGKACSRDGVCLSDCCKFYWYHWECRPASKC